MVRIRGTDRPSYPYGEIDAVVVVLQVFVQLGGTFWFLLRLGDCQHVLVVESHHVLGLPRVLGVEPVEGSEQVQGYLVVPIQDRPQFLELKRESISLL